MHQKKIIYHFVFADSYILTIPIAQEIINNLDSKPFFWVFTDNIQNRERFVKLFSELSFKEYQFVSSSKNTMIDKTQILLWSILTFDLRNLWRKMSYPLFRFFKNYEEDNIVIHGELPPSNAVLYFLNKKVKLKRAWVCWGSLPKKRAWCVNLLLGHLYKGYFIRKCHSVIALTTPDKELMEEQFSCKNVTYAPYMLPIEDLGYCEDSHNVLIGNSGSYIDDYIRVANDLSRFKEAICTYMLNYGISSNDPRIKELQHINECSRGSENYNLWTDVVDKNTYNNVLRMHSVYVCGALRQTGLGAIETCLNLGMKIFLNGVNYRYFKDMGMMIYHVNDINKQTEEEFFTFSLECKKHNKQVYFKTFGAESLSAKWNNALLKLR